MTTSLIHVASTGTASFLASLVEFVEALTVILAVGSTRGWRSAVAGASVALLVLAMLVAIFGSALIHIPLMIIQLVVGVLLVLFGLRWLRKAIQRAAGVIPMHDEAALYERETAAMRRVGLAQSGWDKIALAATFQITMLEGIEVVFIVVAMGAGPGLLRPAIQGAAAALLAVIVLGFAAKGPLTKVPENALKFAVGVILTAFGTFWVGEGVGLSWPGGDWALLGLIASTSIVSILCAMLRRDHVR